MISASLAMLLLAGCGDGGAPATTAEIVALCQVQCETRARCEPDKAEPTCRSKCELEGARVKNFYRGDFVRAMGDCYRTVACEQFNSDHCFSRAILEVAPDGQSDPAYIHCLQVREGCRSADKASFSDDYCVQYFALADNPREAFERCYDRPCEEMKGCLEIATGDFD
jgi:hypothetical protein